MIKDDEDRVDEEEIINDEVETNEEVETDPTDSEDSYDEAEESTESIQEDESDDEEDRVVTIGEPEQGSEETAEEKQEAPGWVKKVRKTNRKLESENKKLQRQLEELTKPKEVEVQLGEKPKLADFDYDEAKYDAGLADYYDKKRKVEAQSAKKEELVKVRNEKRSNRITRYVELKKEHKFKDYDEAESVVENTFNLNQQEIIVQGSEDSALVVYALGKNPKKLEELAKIQDPIEFAFKVAKLESQLKVSSRKAPKPEQRISKGKNNGLSGNSDKTLERLRKKAADTGDYTEVTRYKRKLREA